MLRGIPNCITPELLKVLHEMGHGDTIVVGDANFPAASTAAAKGHVNLRCDGHRATELVDAILQLIPLDDFVEKPVIIMNKTERHKDLECPVWDEFKDIVAKYDSRGADAVDFMDRFPFYTAAQNAYAVVSTTETAPYACIILQKGVPVMRNRKREVIDAGIRMLSEGITIGTWGNVTVRDPETGYVYLSPSGMPYRSLTEDDIVVVRLDGSRVEGERKPTIETEMHLAIYRSRPECNAVIHTHPVYSTAFSCMGEDIPLLLDEAAQVLGDVVRTTKYALPGSQALADECVKALGERSMACLLKSHGAVCLGRDLEQAFGNSTVLEATAKVYSVIRAMGGQFDPISPENIAFMQEFVRTKYGQR